MLSLPGDRDPIAPSMENVSCRPGRARTCAYRGGARRDRHCRSSGAGGVPPGAGRAARRSGAIVGTNTGGDQQKALDVAAHEHFLRALRAAGVQAVASEEAEEVALGEPDGLDSVAMDPIDGSSSIGIGALLGTLFAVLPAATARSSTARPGARSWPPATFRSATRSISASRRGDGRDHRDFDPADRVFRIAVENVTIPKRTSEIAFNASVRRHWAPGVRAYVDACLAGRDGERGREFNMRWLAAAVGDLQRILRRGGMFFYAADGGPATARGGCGWSMRPTRSPICASRPGGGDRRDPADPRHRARGAAPAHPLVFGSAEEVETFARYAARDSLS